MLTMTDLFCGAGGSSTGAVQVPGLTIRVESDHSTEITGKGLACSLFAPAVSDARTAWVAGLSSPNTTPTARAAGRANGAAGAAPVRLSGAAASTTKPRTSAARSSHAQPATSAVSLKLSLGVASLDVPRPTTTTPRANGAASSARGATQGSACSTTGQTSCARRPTISRHRQGSTSPDLGKKREQVRQAGNAVTPPAARDLISAVAESLR